MPIKNRWAWLLFDHQYRFNGELLKTRITKGSVIKTFSYDYDHIGRKVKFKHGKNGTEKTVSTYLYDGVGRLKTKLYAPVYQSGSKQSGPWTDPNTWSSNSVPTQNDFATINNGHTVTIPYSTTVSAGGLIFQNGVLQNLGTLKLGNFGSGLGNLQKNLNNNAGEVSGYLHASFNQYHIRGGLKGINLDANNNLTNNLFSYKLFYEDDGTLFGGNIKKQSWKSNIDGKERDYVFSYDGASRLKSAIYNSTQVGESYSLNSVDYDKNGNITALSRNGATNATYSSFGNVDNMTYTYQSNSNKLSKIQDATNGNTDLGDFRDGINLDDDYEYWLDGSLKRDKNKNILSITYNHLKLPETITFDNGRTITTEYDAGGAKLKKIDSNGETTDYEEDEIYINNVLYQTSHDEGRMNASDEYEYNITDHLGNLRVSFRDSLGIAVPVQSIFYDPWGLSMKGMQITRLPTNFNKYQFLNRETQFETGLVDLNNRQYDPNRGQFTSVDPLSELSRQYSPTVYGNNNPVMMIDPDGMRAIWNQKYGDKSDYVDDVTGESKSWNEVQQEYGMVGDDKDKDKGKKGTLNTSPTIAGSESFAPNAPALVGLGNALRGVGSFLGRFAGAAFGIIALAFTMEGDTPHREGTPTRIALGVDGLLADFSSQVGAIPYYGGWANASDEKAAIIASIIALGQKPGTTFHFNLSALNGSKVNDPLNLKIFDNSYTTAEFKTVISLFPEKTYFYIKSGTIYKNVNIGIK